MRSIERCFDTKFWTGSAYRSPGYKGETDDRSQAMAVVSGLASKDKYPALTKVLKKEYHASPYMEKYVLEALFQMGEPAFALERMKQRYTRMLDYAEYTTLSRVGHRSRGLRWRHDQSRLERWPAYLIEPEGLRYRANLSRLPYL